MPRTISETLAAWAVDCGYDDLPEGVIRSAKRSALDFVGVALAGSLQPGGRAVLGYAERAGRSQQASVLGSEMSTSCAEAALANGTLGHLLDFDDMAAGGGHFTATTLPAALAVAEHLGKSGKDLVTAYVLGHEVACRVGSHRIQPSHPGFGWHPTGAAGVFGSAVAACKLLDLDQQQTVAALGMAGSMASGLRENFGTMTKALHAGQAASNGIRAALLAKAGLDSSRSIFEGKYGYCNLLCEPSTAGLILGDLGRRFSMPENVLKLYPCCGGSHSPAFALINLLHKRDLRPEDVETVEVSCDPRTMEILTYRAPKTALEGKFSMAFPLALALRDRRVTLERFTDAEISRPDIISLMTRVKVVTDPSLSSELATSSPVLVSVVLGDGTRLDTRCDHIPGSSLNPISDDDLVAKYRSCARGVLPERKTDQSLELIMGLESVSDVRALTGALTTGFLPGK